MSKVTVLVRLLGLIASVAMWGIGPSAFAAPKLAQPPECPAAGVAEADRQLWLGPADKKASLASHLPWGAPEPAITNSAEHLLVQRDYLTQYNETLRDPVWTAHRLVFADLDPKRFKRANCFRRDVRLAATVASSPTDYDEPIFDQGHMTPNGDMATSTTSVMNSFVMSNMTPQFCQFNEGIWQEFEDLTRRWAHTYETIYIITGAVFDRDNDGKRDDDMSAFHMTSKNGNRRVAIPTAYYKILARVEPNGGLSTITILLPHDQLNWSGDPAVSYLQQHISKISDVENVTGLKFFPTGAPSLTEASALWPFDGAPPQSLGMGDRCQSTGGAIIH